MTDRIHADTLIMEPAAQVVFWPIDYRKTPIIRSSLSKRVARILGIDPHSGWLSHTMGNPKTDCANKQQLSRLNGRSLAIRGVESWADVRINGMTTCEARRRIMTHGE